MSAQELIIEHLDLWTGAVTKKSSSGRGSTGKFELTGVKKLRELILDLALRGKLVGQAPEDTPARALLNRVADERAHLLRQGAIKKPKKLKMEPDQADELFPIPSNWQWSPLDNLAPTPLFDGDWIESKDQDQNGTIRLLQLADIGVGQFKDVSNKHINAETFKRLNCSKVMSGDVLIARLPSPIGRAAIFPGLEQDCITAVDVAILRPDGIVDSKYVVYALNSPTTRAQVESYGKGATRFRISTGNLKTVLIPVPPAEEQHRIVQKVDELMALCDRLEQQTSDQLEAHETLVDTLLGTLTQSENATELADNWARLAAHFDTLFTTEQSIDKLKQTILQLAVMGRLVEQDAGDEPARVLLKRIEEDKKRLAAEGKIKKSKRLPKVMEDEAPFDIPRSWQWTRIQHVSEFITSGSRDWAKYYSDVGAIFITMGNLSRGDYRLRLESIRHVSPPTGSEGARTSLQAGDMVVSITGDVGNLGLIPEGFGEAYINQHSCLVRFSSLCRNRYFAEFLRSPCAKSQFDEPQRGIKNSFRLSDMGEMAVPLPPLKEQHRIVQKVDELMVLCDQLKERLKQASETRYQLADAVVDHALK